MYICNQVMQFWTRQDAIAHVNCWQVHSSKASVYSRSSLISDYGYRHDYYNLSSCVAWRKSRNGQLPRYTRTLALEETYTYMIWHTRLCLSDYGSSRHRTSRKLPVSDSAPISSTLLLPTYVYRVSLTQKHRPPGLDNLRRANQMHPFAHACYHNATSHTLSISQSFCTNKPRAEEIYWPDDRHGWGRAAAAKPVRGWWRQASDATRHHQHRQRR